MGALLYFIKYKNWYQCAPAALQKRLKLFGFWTIKIKILDNLFDEFFKIGY